MDFVLDGDLLSAGFYHGDEWRTEAVAHDVFSNYKVVAALEDADSKVLLVAVGCKFVFIG